MNRVLAILTIFMILVSCSQEFKPEVEDCCGWNMDSLDITSFLPLKAGNYWIYDVWEIDTTGQEHWKRLDSVFVEKDTVIGEVVYWKIIEINGFGGDQAYNKYLRDSDGCVVNYKGEVVFACKRFGDTLRIIDDQGVYQAYYKVDSAPVKLSVPAGNFWCLNYYASVVVDPFFSIWDHPDSYSNYYSPGVGKVRSTAFSITRPVCLERRLVRYFIQ